MMSMNSNNASSSGVDSSKEPPTCAWVSLTLEEQVANFRTNFKRIFRQCYFHENSPDPIIFESIVRVVEALRINPWVDIESLLHRVLYGALDGATPLHWAVLMDDRIMVQYILTSKKVDINAWRLSRVQTALTYAIVGGNCDIVEDLLEHKADVCIYGGFEMSALNYMVQHKDSMFGILQKVLAKNVNMHDKIKNTTLHYAVMEGATDVVTYLLDQEADVNVRNGFEDTPLHYATKKGSLDVVTCLLQQNADVNASNKSGESPLYNAIEYGEMNIVSILMEHNADVEALNSHRESPLLNSIKYKKVGKFNALIAIGANLHVKDEKDNNALHFAIQAHDGDNNMIDIVKVLREHGVDANVQNSNGHSPFFAAVLQGHTNVVKELLQNKEKIKLMDECNGRTAIQIAFDYGHEHIKRVLLECDDISRYVSDLYRDRQVYVDAANAILVGAALIASVTFSSWLQPPLGYTTPYVDLSPSSSNIDYVDVQHNVSLRVFWIFNTLSFYFAIGTVVFGARSVLPRRRMFIKAIVVKLHQNLLVTSILLACSVFFVIIAFGIAGCIVLTPILKFQWYMIVPTIFGGLLCLVSLVLLFKSMVEDNLEGKREKFKIF